MNRKSATLFMMAAAGLATGGAVPFQTPGSGAVLVRVFDGGRFVSDLTLADFEIEEAGIAVAPEGLLLVHRNSIIRREGTLEAWPDVSRKILVLFQMSEYHAKIPEALDYLLKDEIRPGDTLEIQTPMRNYQLVPEALAAKPRADLSRELNDLVKRDIIQGGMGTNSLLREIRTLVRRIGGVGRTSIGDSEGDVDTGMSLEQQITLVKNAFEKLETLREVSENRLVEFAQSLKTGFGRKTVFFVYQREFRPEITPQAVDSLIMNNQDRPDIIAGVQDIFQLSHRQPSLETSKVREAFADSGAILHFLFMNRDPERVSGIVMREQSEDVFKALSAAAVATGGSVNTSQNPATAMIESLKSSEFYYYLRYRPAAAAPPGTFLDLSVRLKGREGQVLHQAGTFSKR